MQREPPTSLHASSFELLSDVPLRLARPREKCNAKLQVPAGVANLPHEPFGQMLDVLAEGPATVASLRKLFNKWADGDRRLVRAIEVLCAVQHAELAIHPSMKPAVSKRFSALSAAIAGVVDRGTDVFYVPTLENGLATSIGILNYFLLRAHRADPARRLMLRPTSCSNPGDGSRLQLTSLLARQRQTPLPRPMPPSSRSACLNCRTLGRI